MKTLTLTIAFMLIAFTGCTSSSKSEMPPVRELSQLQEQPPMGLNELEILRAVTLIKRGDNGSITIKGQAGVSYNITATYKIGDKMFTAFQTRIAEGDGSASWTWTVRPETVPGTYPITISGGGRTVVTSYTVAP